MRRSVLPALVAALVAGAATAKAAEADCDLVCRLQGYLGTDHMAAGNADAAAPPAAAPTRHHAHPATKGTTAPRVAAEPKATPVVPAKPAPKQVAEPAKPSATALPARREAALPKPPAKAAAATPPSKAPPVATRTDTPPVRDASRHREGKPPVVAAATAEPVESTTPEPAPKHHRLAHLVPRSRPAVSEPVASADLIPGSARLVPASFQRFGDL